MDSRYFIWRRNSCWQEFRKSYCLLL